jgi:uncharacterized protein (DUF433 family)
LGTSLVWDWRWRQGCPAVQESCDTSTMATLSVLEREMFSEAEAARLLRVPQSTLHYWLDGGEYRRKTYKPVIRLQPRGDRSVTWAEFVEAGLLREYRRTHRVPMAELRTFIDLLREELGVPYPLAHRKPFVSEGRQLVLQAQDDSGLDADYCLVAVIRGQLILTPPAEAFVERVTWEGDLAAGWRPHDDPDSPVRMEPDVRFGLPSVKGVRTEVLWEHIDAGEGIEDVAEAFDLAVRDVRWALAYENSLHAAA